MVMFWESMALAACTLVGGSPSDQRPFTLVYYCIADAANTIDPFDIDEDVSGELQHTEVVPVTGKEPTSITTGLKTSKITHSGSEIGGSPAYTGSAAIASPWARENLEPPYGFSNGLTVADSVVCDATDEWYRLLTFL